MEPSATGQQAMDRDQEAVHDWRVSQLMRLGLPGTLAEVYADRIDWHQVAWLRAERPFGNAMKPRIHCVLTR